MQIRRSTYTLSDPYVRSRRPLRLSVVKTPSYIQTRNISKKMVVAIGALTFLTLSFLFLTWVRVGQLQSGYALARLENEQLSLIEQERALKLEIAVLKRPERIRRIATTKLKLKAPLPSQIIRFKEPIGVKK